LLGSHLSDVQGDQVGGPRAVFPAAFLAVDEPFRFEVLQGLTDGLGREARHLRKGRLRGPRLVHVVGKVGQGQQDQLSRRKDALNLEGPIYRSDAHACPPLRFSWARMA
jgi:hypothetical protein